MAQYLTTVVSPWSTKVAFAAGTDYLKYKKLQHELPPRTVLEAVSGSSS